MRRRLALSLVIMTSCSAFAGPSEWTYTVLNPAGQPRAIAYGIGGGVAVGFQGPSSAPRATIWPTLSPSDAQSLHPAFATESNIVATTGTQHVGNVVIGGVRRAGLWNGAAFTSLHISGYEYTYAQGTDGTHQSGLGRSGDGTDSALWWSGTSASAVVLNPAGSAGAAAYATGGGRQVGWAEFASHFGRTIAGYWSGTAASWTRLDSPPEIGTTSAAVAISADGVTQAGYVVGRTGSNWAALWRGTPDSFTSLHPDDATASSVLATDNNFQAGWSVSPAGGVAAVWEGTKASFTDLDSILPAMYTVSRAYGVESTDTDVWVTGYAYKAATDTFDALVWHKSIPAPGGTAAAAMMLLTAARRRRAIGRACR